HLHRQRSELHGQIRRGLRECGHAELRRVRVVVAAPARSRPRLDGADLHDRGTVAEPGGRAGRTAHPRPSRTRSAGRQGPEGRLNRCRPTATSLTERGCTAERPAPHRPRSVAGVGLWFAGNGAVLASILPWYPLLVYRLGLNSWQFGLAVACYAAGSLLSSGLPAALIARFGAHRVVIGGTVLLGLAA